MSWYDPQGVDKVRSLQAMPSSGSHGLATTPNGIAATGSDQYTAIVLLGVNGEPYARLALAPGSVYFSDGTQDPTNEAFITNMDKDGLQAYAGGPFWVQTAGGSALSFGRTVNPGGSFSNVATQIALQASTSQNGVPIIEVLDLAGNPLVKVDPVTGDVTIVKNTAGAVLADRSNGHTYRLKVAAGVLGVEQVT